MAEALGLILSQTKLLVEPAGAAGVAALLNGKIPLEPTDTVVALLSGGNIDLHRLTTLL
jgi:threonine dehydratase